MAYEGKRGGAGLQHRIRSSQERERAFVSASRHSRLVFILRRLLPVVAVFVLAAYFFSTRMNVTVGDVSASIDGMEIADGALRMLNPTLKGSDEERGDYVVTADYADQEVEQPNLIKLHAIKADMTDPSGGWSRMQAARGKFDSKAERLIMKDQITITTSTGVTGELSYATLDMANQTLRSHSPVFFKLTNGTVRANALTLRSSENTMIFRGNVAVKLGGLEPRAGGTDAAASLPSAVQAPKAPQATASPLQSTAP